MRRKSRNNFTKHYLTPVVLFSVRTMSELKRIVILSIIWILDTVDSILQFFGVKVFKITWDRVYNSLSPEEQEEAEKPDVAVPFKIFVKVRWSKRNRTKCEKNVPNIKNVQTIKPYASLASLR